MNIFRRGFLAALCSLCGSNNAHSQQAVDFNIYDNLRRDLPNMKALMVQNLEKTESDIIQNIYITADPTGTTNAAAYINPLTGRKEIAIPVGVYQLFSYITTFILGPVINWGIPARGDA